MPVIQCPGCSKKLKLKALREGAKVKCPGCAQVFQPTAEEADSAAPASPAKRKPAAAAKAGPKKKAAAATPAKKRPVKKKRPAPVDDFDDFGDDYDDYDDYDDFGGDDFGGGDDYGQPARRPASGGRKAAKKKPAPKKSKTPLIIGLAVVAVAAIGGGAFFLLSGDSEPSDTGANVAENGDTEHENDQPGGGHGGNSGGNDTGHGNGEQAVANAQEAVLGPSEFKWLPQDTEVFVQLQFSRLLDSPVGDVLKSPMLVEPLAELENKAGVQLKNIESITIGVTGVSKTIKNDAVPSPGDFPFVAVIRCKTVVNISNLQPMIPNATSLSHENRPYLQFSDGKAPPVAMLNGDDKTLILCPASTISTVMNSESSSPKMITQQMIRGDDMLKVVFAPEDSDTVFRSEQMQSQSDPTKQMMVEFLTAIKPVTEGVSVRANLSNDADATVAVITKDSQSAATATTAIRQLVSNVIRIRKENIEGQIPAPMQAMLDIGVPGLESMQIESVGNSAEATLLMPDAGNKMKEEMAPMAFMLPFLIGPILSQNQPASHTPGFHSTGSFSPSTGGPPAQDNLKQIALAMHYFHDAYGRFPNAAAKLKDETPLLSWRVHLLPYLGLKDLYDQFNVKEPWDSPTNRPLVEQMPGIYRCPEASTQGGKTVYMVPTSPGTAFEGDTGRSMSAFKDGTSNTILLVEVETQRAVEWTRPADYTFPPSDPLEGLLPAREEGYKVAFADGSIQTIEPSTSPQEAMAKFTHSAGD